MKQNAIYEMRLHETISIGATGGISHPTIAITRVAGGWIYSFRNSEVIFIPFNNEFME